MQSWKSNFQLKFSDTEIKIMLRIRFLKLRFIRNFKRFDDYKMELVPYYD